jgi:hypothetical protein
LTRVCELSAHEAAGNAAHATSPPRSSSSPLLGVENLVVVTAPDAVLVYLQRQAPALLHHDALDLIALALIERLIRAP